VKGQMTHPEPDALAEFRAGLVTGRRRAGITSHLAACDRCAGLSDQLAEIPALLAAAPAPAMPGDVSRRLDLALAAEAAERDSSERTADDSPAHRATSPRPRRPWNYRLVAQRILVPAAAVVVLAAGGYGLSRVMGSGSPGSAASRSEAAPATSAAPANGIAEPASAARSRSDAIPAIEAPLKFEVVTSGTDFMRATLPQQLERELQRHAQVAASTPELTLGPLKGCVLRVTKGTRPGTLALVEKARFQGQPAIVIVAVSGDHDAAWVTASGCSASSDHVLATATLPGTSAP
jgi:hypothetical protein